MVYLQVSEVFLALIPNFPFIVFPGHPLKRREVMPHLLVGLLSCWLSNPPLSWSPFYGVRDCIPSPCSFMASMRIRNGPDFEFHYIFLFWKKQEKKLGIMFTQKKFLIFSEKGYISGIWAKERKNVDEARRTERA